MLVIYFFIFFCSVNSYISDFINVNYDVDNRPILLTLPNFLFFSRTYQPL